MISIKQLPAFALLVDGDDSMSKLDYTPALRQDNLDYHRAASLHDYEQASS
jgi:hypothetical protein